MTLRLLFCKSHIYIHKSKDSKDNLNGFIIITNERDSQGQDAVLSWISATALDAQQMNWLFKKEMVLVGDEKGEEPIKNVKMNSQILNIAKSGSMGSFSISLSSLYSIEFRNPSPSGWWYGSMVIHSLSALEDSTLPVLFFHDNLCPSTKRRQAILKKSFDPFADTGGIYWGGIDLRNKIGELVDLQRTYVDKSVWLINATLDDLRNFSTNNLTKANVKGEGQDDDGSIISDELWSKWEATKWSVMSQIANATSKTGSFVSSLVKKHPIVKLVEQNRENRYVKQMLENPRVQEVQDDFDSAKIYLAKWALGVKEEADRYQLNNQLNETYRKLLTNDLGIDFTGDTNFSPLELNKAMQRSFPLTRPKWESFFDSQGRLAITVTEVKDYIFHGGVEDMELRKEVWLFLFEVYPWDSSKDEREQILATLNESYQEYKNKWLFKVSSFDDEEEMEREESYWNDQVFRIEKDVLRNDRNVDIYHNNTEDGKPAVTEESTNTERTEEGHTQEVASEQEDSSDHWTIYNPHLLKLRDILKTYNIYNDNLGYVQGMCDLLSPIYYIFQDETLSFWCFVKFMDRMERNFLRDQSGIRDQMLTMAELTTLMLPQLSEHLKKCDSSNLFFCFRMLLVWFKREFPFKDVCSIWEIFLTDYYSSQFQLFFMLAILQKNSQPILQNLNQFDQVIKYFNDLHNTMDWNDLMIRSELLFIRFQKLMNFMDRREEQHGNVQGEDIVTVSSDGGDTTTAATSGVELHEVDSNGEEQPVTNRVLPNHSQHLQLLLQKKIIIQREPPRTHDSVK
ncbi:GTPase activating protein [Monosporozyma unispora]|nr:GTPase activating protein [Kazachstania unispora]